MSVRLSISIALLLDKPARFRDPAECAKERVEVTLPDAGLAVALVLTAVNS
jgi:hypothetical protein